MQEEKVMSLVNGKSLTVLFVLIILSAFVYGFAAANTVPETGAGDGSGTVSGYTITNVNWTLLASSPNQLDGVDLDVAATAGAGAASDVRVTVDGGTTWVTCSGPTGSTWACSFASGSEPSVSAVSALQVVAVE
jgi:hypothetical protein